MSKIRFTITTKPGELLVGETITLTKEPTNQFDDEAIKVSTGSVSGYVGAYYKTLKPGTYSAGRLLDKIPFTTKAVVVADRVGEVEVA